MNRNFVALFIIFAILFMEIYIVFSSGVFTGLAPSQQLSLNIGSVLEGRITHFSYNYILRIYESVNITLEFTNFGSVDLTERMQIDILDMNLSTITSFYDDQTRLVPGTKRSLKAIYYPNMEGYHWIRARVYYEDRIAEVWGAFYVFPPEIPEELPPVIVYIPTTPLPPIIITPPEEKGFADMFLDYQKSIEIAQGQSAVIYVVVENTGEVSLNNVMLSLSSGGLSFDVNPKIIPRLSPKFSGTFLVTINTYENTPVGNYTVFLTARSDEVTKEGEISVEVKRMVVEEELYQKILNYIYLINKVGQEIEKASLEGRNVTLASQHLEDAKGEIEKAKKSYGDKDYVKTREYLGNVKKSLELAVMELALSATPRILYLSPMYYLLLLIILLIITITLIWFLIFYKRRKKKEKEIGYGTIRI